MQYIPNKNHHTFNGSIHQMNIEFKSFFGKKKKPPKKPNIPLPDVRGFVAA